MNNKGRKPEAGKTEAELVSTSAPEELNAEQAVPRTEETTPRQTASTELSGGQSAQKGNMSVFLYISLLFSAALLLMGLSSLIHQRNNTEALGKLQSSVSVMREAQNLQERIIALQDAQRELEERLKNAQSDWSNAVAEAATERKRAEALERLYVMETLYQAEDYTACQTVIDEFEANGLTENLPSESSANGVLSPLERYRQIQESVPVRIAETSPPPDAPDTGETS